MLFGDRIRPLQIILLLYLFKIFFYMNITILWLITRCSLVDRYQGEGVQEVLS
jgi:hypothetical protein